MIKKDVNEEAKMKPEDRGNVPDEKVVKGYKKNFKKILIGAGVTVGVAVVAGALIKYKSSKVGTDLKVSLPEKTGEAIDVVSDAVEKAVED
jgi:hypothetical protein